MIISFAYTTSALLAGAKTVTRRDWDHAYADQFIDRLNATRDGLLVDAYDKSPRFKGRKVATILIKSITHELLTEMPDEDYEREGFVWLNAHKDQISPSGRKQFGNFDWFQFDEWRRSGGFRYCYVIRFELVSKEAT